MKDLLPVAEKLATRLKERGETVAVSESSAGGLISVALLAVPGASAYFLGGAVVYTRLARGLLLDIPEAALTGIRPAAPQGVQLKAPSKDRGGRTHDAACPMRRLQPVGTLTIRGRTQRVLASSSALGLPFPFRSHLLYQPRECASGLAGDLRPMFPLDSLRRCVRYSPRPGEAGSRHPWQSEIRPPSPAPAAVHPGGGEKGRTCRGPEKSEFLSPSQPFRNKDLS